MFNRLVLLCLVAISIATLQGCAGPVVVAGGAAAGVAGASADRRPPETIVADQEIELSIGKQIYEHPKLKRQVHINITSYNGVVLLSGEAPDAERRQLMAELARRVKGVKKVYNEVVIGPESTLGVRTQDTWITTKIKSRLAAEKEINPIHIKVVTESKTVYLMGIVTRAEADAATLFAQKTDGVVQVVRLFEYLD